MIEISLDEFEEFYKEKIDEQFYKQKRVASKLINDIKSDLIEIKVCMDHFLETGEDKVDKKAIRSLHFFSDRIRKEIDEIDIPEEEISYDNIIDLFNSIKRLFVTINEIARKSLPKFKSEVQNEIKELNYLTRKLGKRQQSLDQFLRKKYNDVRIAEEVLKKLPKFFTLKENIEKTKSDLDQLEKDIELKKEEQEQLNKDLLELEKDPLFKKLETEKDKVFKLKIDIRDKLGFRKALKKLKVEMEKNTISISNLNISYLNNFLKSPINTLVKDDKNLSNFKSLLVQLRHTLEENKLNLKSDKKEKTIEQINTIFDERTIYDDLEQLEKLNEVITNLKSKVKDAGLSQKLEELKNEISINALKLEHSEADFARRNKDYIRYLGNLKKEREDFQKSVEQFLKEEVKINITFSF